MLSADSAAHCISLCAEHHPDAVLLDMDILHVDQWSVPEQLQIVNPDTVVVLAVEDPAQWDELPPFVAALANRNHVDDIISLLRYLPGQD
ncbi:MAG: hypothetical protein AB7O65_08560 [Candidatus Korobacteraceae bacterium]